MIARLRDSVIVGPRRPTARGRGQSGGADPSTAGCPRTPGPLSRYPAISLSPAKAAALAPCLVLAIALAACRGPGAPPAGRERLGAEPQVRVGIVVDSAAAQLSATTPYELATTAGDVVARGDPAATWTVVADSSGRLSGSAGAARFDATAGPLVLRQTGPGALRVNGRPYRGSVLVRSDGPGRVTVVNVLDMEAYLLGVVPFEIGRRTPAEVEAVKSQAVAARTYAVGNMGKSARPFDFYATVQDQVYGGLSGEDSVASRAVAETRGEIVTYQGQPILAYYSSTCGGHTAAINESWPWRAPQPYLQSVSDMVPGSDRAYCDISNRYRWRTSWTLDQLKSVLRTTLAALTHRPPVDVRSVDAVRIVARTPSGRVDSLLIRANGEDHIVRADSLRWILKTPSGAGLNSSLLFDAVMHAPGDSIALEVHGGGWGHAIGMCQFGAIGRARAGQSYRQILGTYYQGTQVTRLY